MSGILLVAACALVDADGRVLLAKRPAGKPLAGLWDYAAGGHALRIREGRADVTLPYEITRTGSGFELALRAASLDIRGLAVRPRQEEVDWLTVPALRVEGSLTSRRLWRGLGFGVTGIVQLKLGADQPGFHESVPRDPITGAESVAASVPQNAVELRAHLNHAF